jgi:tetratricopeptide (TPR) repeat protein
MNYFKPLRALAPLIRSHRAIYRPQMMSIPIRTFSNFKPLPESDDETAEIAETKTFTKFNPETADPDIDPAEFKRMQSSIARFSQAMQIGKYGLAQ